MMSSNFFTPYSLHIYVTSISDKHLYCIQSLLLQHLKAMHYTYTQVLAPLYSDSFTFLHPLINFSLYRLNNIPTNISMLYRKQIIIFLDNNSFLMYIVHKETVNSTQAYKHGKILIRTLFFTKIILIFVKNE